MKEVLNGWFFEFSKNCDHMAIKLTHGKKPGDVIGIKCLSCGKKAIRVNNKKKPSKRR